ncbi:MAG: prepilin-type N-terminal cleavage/methylation domain-containing protein [Sumerlaeia bacterium]
MTKRRTKRGFTLVEIILVTLILTVLLVAVVTNYSAAYDDMALERDAKLMAATLFEGHTRARSEGRDVCLLIHEDRQGYHLEAPETSDRSGAGAVSTEPLADDLGLPVRLSRGVEIGIVQFDAARGGDPNRVWLFSDGRIDGGVIVLTGRGGREAELRVPPRTGLTEIDFHYESRP